MDLKKLLEERGLLLSDMEKLSGKADAEKRDFTEDEQKEFDRLASEAETLNKRIERAKKLDEMRSVASADIRQGERTPERAVPTEDGKKKEESRGGFESLGEMLKSVAQAADPHARKIDPRLVETRAASGLNEGVPSEGGFLVQKELINDLLTRTYDTGRLARDVRRFQVGAGKNGIAFNVLDETSRVAGSRLGGIQVYWTAEAGQKMPSRPTFARKDLPLQKLAALLYATDELLEDAVALESMVRQMFPQEFAYALDEAILRGDGVGKPQGILESPALIKVSRAGGGAISYADVLAMYSRFSGDTGKWYINRDTLPSLATMAQVIGSGGVPVWMPANGAAGQLQSTLFGLPVQPIEQASTLGTTGDILLADPKEYLLIEKGGLKTDVSIHVRFIYDESVFRFVLRVNGMPVWSSALTPAQGTNTTSPYVALT